MLALHHEQIRAVLREAVATLGLADALPADAVIALEPTKQSSHGDLACNLAMQLARPARRPPCALAQQLVDALNAHALADPSFALERAEVAGPGFVNLWLRDSARQAVVAEIIRAALHGPAFGDRVAPDGTPRTLVEFVSANPTGPLHVGHGRQAALGDGLAAILASQGVEVAREFYYNDAGAQISNLARSVQARLNGIEPGSAEFPADGYHGEYIVEIAQGWLRGDTVEARTDEPGGAAEHGGGADDPHGADLDAVRRFAVAWLRREQDQDLAAFGVRFDRYFLESSLYADGRVDDVVGTLVRNGHAYEADGALWLRSTDYGDDKDRVMRKSDGSYTYFVPDVAYHTTKFERGFRRAINVQGSDHHGTVARVRAGLQALERGIPAGYPDYVLHKMVRVVRTDEAGDKHEVKISKRAGSYVTVRDLIEWSGQGDVARGRDAVRFFLMSRKGDSEFTFDVDLALSSSSDNPVYYVQYAHARICRILVASTQPQLDGDAVADWPAALQQATQAAAHAPLARLSHPADFALIARLAAFPGVLAEAAAELSPHPVPHYLKELASSFHTYYDAQRVLVDDAQDRQARLALLAATRICLARGLALLGVSAPEKM